MDLITTLTGKSTSAMSGVTMALIMMVTQASTSQTSKTSKKRRPPTPIRSAASKSVFAATNPQAGRSAKRPSATRSFRTDPTAADRLREHGFVRYLLGRPVRSTRSGKEAAWSDSVTLAQFAGDSATPRILATLLWTCPGGLATIELSGAATFFDHNPIRPRTDIGSSKAHPRCSCIPRKLQCSAISRRLATPLPSLNCWW
jgi:hypothetical protein